MTDVSITCGNQIIRAHRTVLSIFSPFFRRVFDSIQNPMHYPFIVLKDMPYVDLMAIINLMYRGEVTVTQDQFSSLKQSAKVLEVSELSDIITSYEEKNDIKPRLENNILSSARNTRKRGRPKRYCEDSDEEFKVFDTPPPPTKRQLPLTRASTATTAIKKTIQTITPATKTSISTRGGTNLSFSKQAVRVPTAIRGGHSAFSKPQTATRGGLSNQLLTRGSTYRSRNTRGQYTGSQEDDEDFDPLQELRRTTVRRGRVGRPPRTASLTREDMGLPMATSLPVSLPEPLGVDLGNIFTNYNLNDVTSSTSNASKPTIAVQFEPTIKQEPDSDSEVECIMSGTSPLPSGVLDEGPEITESSANEVSNSDSQTAEPTEGVLDPSVHNTDPPVEAIPDPRPTPEMGRNEVSVESEFETNILSKDVVISAERSESPVPGISQTTEETQESTVSSVRRGSDDIESVITNLELLVDTSSTSERTTQSVTVSTASTNRGGGPLNVPLLRHIKSERISPPPVVQTSFQSIDGQNNDGSNSCDPEITSVTSIPVLSRVKIERISPKNMVNDSVINISVENSQTANDSSDVSSSHNHEPRVEITNVFSESQSATQSDDQQASGVTASDNSECTSSSGQEANADNSEQQIVVQNNDAVDEIDVQDIAFDCFYSNDDQQMHTYSSETPTSSAPSHSNSHLGFNTTADNSINEDTPNFTRIVTNNTNEMSFTTTSNTNSVITSSEPTQQFFAVNTTQQMTNISNTNTFPMDNNNVVMNSPLHSDEECMLLDSPQQSAAYEVTIGSDHNLDDSMDNL